jgi:chitin-binding protein
VSKDKTAPGIKESTASSSTPAPLHGRVTTPPSRAALYLPEWVANEMEAGKFFPETAGGLSDPVAPDDVKNEAPPVDGKIASVGRSEALALDAPKDPSGSPWKRHPVASGESLTIEWAYTMPHKTRRWNYFITKSGWDPNKPLTRAQFETKPFHTVQLSCQPYWACQTELNPPNPTSHTMTLLQRQGHHVILAVWEVADTARAFYQVIDVEFPA